LPETPEWRIFDKAPFFMSFSQTTGFLLIFALVTTGCDSPRQAKTAPGDDEAQDVNRAYYKDGKLETEIPMRNGKKHGIARSYYPNGKLRLELEYRFGKKEGLSKRYYESGALYQTTEYKQDMFDGIQTKYRENGNKISEQPYHLDLPCLGLKEYLLDGSPRQHYPTIVITPVDELLTKGEYRLMFSTSDKKRKVKYYRGKLSAAGCLTEALEPVFFDEDKGVGVITFYLRPGEFYMEELNVIARIETANNNFYVTQRTYHLSIDN